MNVSIPAIDREAPPAYAELHCCSNFSFLRGASHPEELVAQAQALGYAALALTDECSLAGVVRAHAAARDLGIQLIIGSEFKLSDGPRLVLLATDRASYGNLSELITHARRAASKGRYRLGRADVERLAGGCLALWLPTALDEVERHRADGPWIARAFPRRAWIAVELVRDGRDRARLAALTALGRDLHLPLVAGGDVHMHARSRRALQDVLTAIRLGTTVEAAVAELLPNGERCLRARKTLAKLYPPELLAETLRVAERCRFSLDELRYEYPEELVPAGETPASHLRQLTEAGLQRRWPAGAPPKVRQLVEHELALIAELHYEPYFLTVHDIVHFARARGILCQGRGSAANSAVCFGLGITEVDPARIETLFERFVSKERNEPPDIDVDFEHERREEVIQYLYSKYGRERAALAATVITYRPKSAVRDVGKALGFSLEQVDSLAGNLAWWDGGILPDRLEEAGFDTQNPKVRLLLQLVQTLIGFPRHLSQHVGGFVIARDALSRLVPIENAAMPERTVIQWDKDDLDALGLLKVDVLGLGMLTAIRKGFDLVRAYRGQELTMATIPPEDPEVYAMIQQADTTGVFQIESRAQMAMLPRLKPACFYDLVIEVAIMRPGPIQGDMVHPYLRRRQGLEPVSYPSEAVREVLARTLGVPIFQEQVIKLAMVAAGFTPGEADRLRRSMAAFRRRGGIDQFEARLIEGMRARGYSETFARQIFRQIEGFGEYGFPESHSASFALLVYVSAWLKRYEPAAFLCALLNSQPMGFYAPTQLVQDARRHGVEVRAVDVRASGWDCRLETDLPGDSTSYPWRDPCSSDQPQPGLPWPGVRRRGCTLSASAKPPAHPAVRLGFRLVKGLTQAGAERLVQARDQTPFAGVEDLAFRARLAARDMQALATADALRGLIGHRRRAHWAAAGVEAPTPLLQRVEIPEALPLLRTPTEGEDIVTDYASLGLTLRRHPVALLRAVLAKRSLLAAAEVRALQHGKPVSTAGLVICRQHPSSGNGVIFVTLEDETGHTNIIVWPKLAERQHRELLHARLLGVVGEVQREGEVLHVLAKKLEDYSGLLGELTAPSRDFR